MKKIIAILLLSTSIFAEDLISIFPLDNYDQDISHWIKSSDSDYDTRLLPANEQNERFSEFYLHYYSSSADGLSPWSANYVTKILTKSANSNLLKEQLTILNQFANQQHDPKKMAYGENYRPYSPAWFEQIAANMDIGTNQQSLTYQAKERGITLKNALVRALPTNDPLFYSHKLAGEGFPFDNLQNSAIFTGMPVYIVKASKDKAWTLVITPDDTGWVDSTAIARVDDKFINAWQAKAHKGIAAITHVTSGSSSEGVFRGLLYNGSTLPILSSTAENYQVLFPVAKLNGFAAISSVNVTKSAAIKMPIPLTPHNMATMIQNQIGKPYGWGSTYFDYDCSAELKALFTPFGIYLPRNSVDQADAGTKVAILDNLTTKEREAYLLKNGHKLVTLIQIPGHILLYLGNYPNPVNGDSESVAISYQNIWGLRTANNDTRAIIGGSVILPLLISYPENKNLVSFYDQETRKKFRLIYLDNR